MAKRKPKVWVARDKCEADTLYVLGTGRLPDVPLRSILGKPEVDWTASNRRTMCVCPDILHAISDIRLKPGEGPVEVEVTLRRAKQKRESK